MHRKSSCIVLEQYLGGSYLSISFRKDQGCDDVKFSLISDTVMMLERLLELRSHTLRIKIVNSLRGES